MLTDGILTREIFLRKAVVDDSNAFGALVVRIGNKAPAQQRNTHRLQIFRLDNVLQGAGEIPLAHRLWLPLGPEANLVIPSHGMGAPMQGDVLDTGHPANHGVYL